MQAYRFARLRVIRWRNAGPLAFSMRTESVPQRTATLDNYFAVAGAYMNSITPKELKEKLDQGQNVVLIDVREENERALCHIGGTLIPLSQIPARAAEIPNQGNVVIYCRSGGRSGKAIEFLESQGYTNLQNLTGGVLRWSDDVDASVVKY